MEWCRPFLAPLYSWSSAVPAGAILPLPPMLKLVLGWLGKELRSGRRTSSARPPVGDYGELFRADAKAEENLVTLGGWRLAEQGSGLATADWFSLRVTAEEAPWLFFEGHASRTVATSEFLATLICVMLFTPKASSLSGFCKLTGSTDNRGNRFAVAKLLTTKYPLAPVLMELSTQLATRSLWMDLEWLPRELNQEADDLTNENFSKLRPERRVHVAWKDLKFEYLEELTSLGMELQVEVLQRREEKKKAGTGRQKKRKRDSSLSPWG